MTDRARERLTALVRRSDADLAEAALLCEAEVDPTLDVDGSLLRFDALTDTVRTRGFDASTPTRAAAHLVAALAGAHGLCGVEPDKYHTVDAASTTRVLDTRRGLPITLAIVYVAVARRLGVAAFPIHLPGHVVVGVADAPRPVVIDPFHGGRLLDEAGLSALVAAVTDGGSEFHRAMLRPAPTVAVVRRLLNNLTRACTGENRPFEALRTVETRLLLANSTLEDHRIHGDLLARVGRFDAAARAYETYLEASGARAAHHEDVRTAAIRARARLN